MKYLRNGDLVCCADHCLGDILHRRGPTSEVTFMVPRLYAKFESESAIGLRLHPAPLRYSIQALYVHWTLCSDSHVDHVELLRFRATKSGKLADLFITL